MTTTTTTEATKAKGKGGRKKAPTDDVQTGSSVPSTETMTMHLEVPLTEEERDARFRALMDKRNDRVNAIATAKAKAKESKEQIAVIEAEIDRLFDVVQRKVEKRPITCFRRADFKRGVFEWVREDNGKVALTTPMTTHDKQLGIPAVAKPADAAKAASESGVLTMVEVIDATGKSYNATSEIAQSVRDQLRKGLSRFWCPPGAKTDLELVMVRGEPVYGLGIGGERVALTAPQIKAYRYAKSKGERITVESEGKSIEIDHLEGEDVPDAAAPKADQASEQPKGRGGRSKKGAKRA
jgi:molecular chaperone GrpE (heat shock protein)